MASSRSVCRLFYDDCGGGVFACKQCGKTRKQQPSSGYSNLISHLASKHPDYMDVWNERQRAGSTSLEDHGFVDERTMEAFKWMEWVIMRNHPTSEVDDPLTRAIARLQPISSKALLKYMRHVAVDVGKKISSQLGDEFGFMFDGWSCGTLHFVGMYGVAYKDGQRFQPLLAISPAQHGQTAKAHVQMIESVLGVYDKDRNMLRFAVGDNCNINKAIADQLGVPLVGCASHRYNLAMGLFLREHQVLIDKVDSLCAQLRLPNNAADLARHTRRKPLKANITRWSSTYKMLKRYVEIRDAIRLVPDVEDFVPTSAQHRQVVHLVSQLDELDSVTVQLQDETCSLADVRVLFDAVANKYPIMADKLKPTASIVHSPAFESACVKVSQGRPLSTAESNALKQFEVTRPDKEKPATKNFAVETLRKAKKPKVASANYSELLGAIPPTSNRCERLFSQCKLVLATNRASMLPENFETIMFLRANRSLWTFGSLLGCVEDEEE